MKSAFKILINILGMVCLCVACFFGVSYVDEHNLTLKLKEGAPHSIKEAIDGLQASTADMKKANIMDFAHPHDVRPIFIDISTKGSKDKHHRYIYPTQIYYATTDNIKMLFRDKVESVTNNWKLKKLTEQLKNALPDHFFFTKSYIINKAAIVGLRRESHENIPHQYFIELINGESLPFGPDKYRELLKIVDLAGVQ
jgi:DNA-binding LytR/AlgR family response regulator